MKKETKEGISVLLFTLTNLVVAAITLELASSGKVGLAHFSLALLLANVFFFIKE